MRRSAGKWSLGTPTHIVTTRTSAKMFYKPVIKLGGRSDKGMVLSPRREGCCASSSHGMPRNCPGSGIPPIYACSLASYITNVVELACGSVRHGRIELTIRQQTASCSHRPPDSTMFADWQGRMMCGTCTISISGTCNMIDNILTTAIGYMNPSPNVDAGE